jgi:drug/metabolite transporter (DMT)-like permease
MTRWLLVAVIVAATACGQVLQAAAMRRQGEVRDFRPGAMRRLLSALARNGRIIASVAAMAVSFFAFMALLSVSDMSFAVPATAASYILETFLARYLLKEPVHWERWAGASLVACGVALLAL